MSTTVWWILVLGATLAPAVYAILIHNNLVRLKHRVAKAWSNIDVVLKQRHDELPKLIETCRQHMGYEQNVLEKVIRARANAETARAGGDVQGVGQAESQMRKGLGNLFAVAEDYPELKANESFAQLQSRINGLEETIADRREFYNESVNLNNVRIRQFPDILVAKPLGFDAKSLLEFDAGEIADVDVRSVFAT